MHGSVLQCIQNSLGGVRRGINYILKKNKKKTALATCEAHKKTKKTTWTKTCWSGIFLARLPPSFLSIDGFDERINGGVTVVKRQRGQVQYFILKWNKSSSFIFIFSTFNLFYNYPPASLSDGQVPADQWASRVDFFNCVGFNQPR